MKQTAFLQHYGILTHIDGIHFLLFDLLLLYLIAISFINLSCFYVVFFLLRDPCFREILTVTSNFLIKLQTVICCILILLAISLLLTLSLNHVMILFFSKPLNCFMQSLTIV